MIEALTQDLINLVILSSVCLQFSLGFLTGVKLSSLLAY